MKQSLAIKPTTLRIPPDLLRRAARIADLQDRTRSHVIIRLLEEGLEREERKVLPTGGALD